MIRYLIFIFILNSFLPSVEAQTVFHTADISNFYEAFDSIQTTSEKEKQLEFVQELYINRGSEGLKYTIRINEQNGLTATSEDWLRMMHSSQEHFEKIRPFFSTLSNQMSVLEANFLKFKKLYPSFTDGNVYFIVGLGLFGGRPDGTDLYIGCELLASEKPNWAVNIVLHEYVHTLQKHSNNALLAHSLNEGACDFIAELISGIPLREVYPNGYIDFGYKYEAEIWQEFKKYISSSEKGRFFDWLYGTKGKIISGQEMKDLGYFVGYKICKSYYDNAVDKTQAIKDIIEMDVSQDEFARAFLIASNYVPEKDRKFIENFKFAKLTEVKGSFKFKKITGTRLRIRR
ncbi:hypothetical protein SAMN06298216_3920 [Spirosomataceae bacterium TFI 002]|nr:hypothetical protein SAMN06298216_3920 [Spirosomataceae bacterium TFI 002]